MTGRRRSVLRGRLVTPERILADGVVAIDDAHISWVGDAGAWRNADGWPPATEVEGTVLPGLVDVHCHGAAGFGFPDADPAGARAAGAPPPAYRATTLLASPLTAPEPQLLRAPDVFPRALGARGACGSHLAGP